MPPIRRTPAQRAIGAVIDGHEVPIGTSVLLVPGQPPRAVRVGTDGMLQMDSTPLPRVAERMEESPPAAGPQRGDAPSMLAGAVAGTASASACASGAARADRFEDSAVTAAQHRRWVSGDVPSVVPLEQRRLTLAPEGQHRVVVKPDDMLRARFAPWTGEALAPHQLRMTAAGGWARDAPWVGRIPVQPVVADGVDGFLRTMPPDPAHFHRVAANFPFAFPGQVLKTDDIVNQRLFQRSPQVQQALAELDAPRETWGALAHALHRIIGDRPAPFDPRVEPGDISPLHPRSGLLLNDFVQVQGQFLDAFTAFRQQFEQFFGAPGGRALFDALMQASNAQASLQTVLHRARPPIEPRGLDIPPTREEMEATARLGPDAIDALVRQSSIPERLEHIDAAKDLVPDGAFAGVHAVCVQHVLGTQVPTFQALVDKGLDPASTEIVGVPYSTSYVVEHALKRRGFTVNTPDVVDPNDVGTVVERAAIEALGRALERARKDGKPILVLDDGGKASTAIAKHFAADAHRFRVVEQTTRGITELSSLSHVPFPVVDVARAPLKRHETPKIGAEVVRAVRETTAFLRMEVVREKPACVLGYGVIGEGVAGALRDQGARVTVWDIDPAKRQAARAAGFDVPEDRAAALGGKAVVIGATGRRSITDDDIALLSHETVLASASSRDVEIDLSSNRDPSTEVVPLLAAGPGDTRFVTRVWRMRDKDIVVLRNGFPVNFNGRIETGTNESIQQTRAIMLLGAAQAVKATVTGVAPLDRQTQRSFARKVGVEIPADLSSG